MQNPHLIDNLALIRQGTENKFPVSCREFRVFLRPLTMDETTRVTNETAMELDRMPKASQTRITESSLYAKKVLQLASTPEPDSDVMGQITEYTLSKMTDREINFLFKQYAAGCDKLDPDFEFMTVKEIKELAEQLKKSPLAVTELSFLELTSLCRHLILEDSPEDKSLGG
jgi:hypothetical protein